MRFCPECGTPVTPGAKFCVECGKALADFAAAPQPPAAGVAPPSAGREPGAPAAGGRTPIKASFIAVLAGGLIIGLVAAVLILRKLPERERELATAPAQSARLRNLPAGHPQVVKLPDEALKFIKKVQAKAEAAPKDIAAWNHLGDVTERAGLFDPSYYAVAQRAYSHVLKLDPNNLGALRGVGNLDYDRHHYAEAIAAYEHYLSRKPDDPRVRTDLGTMYLSSGNTDVALSQYKKVIAEHPKFFEAYFNLGVAYAEMDDKPTARSYFLKARALAPDEKSRGEIDQMIAAVGGSAGGQSSTVPASAAKAGAGAANFEDAFARMARALPVAGRKVHSVQWTGKTRVRLLMNDFPMDRMPPFAATRFLDDLRSGTRGVMKSYHLKGPVTVEIADQASNRMMQSVTVSANAPAAPGSKTAATPTASKGTSSSATFHGAVTKMLRNLPVAGRKVTSVQWPSTMRAKVMMDNFPMDAMPPFARDKFISDIKTGLRAAKTAHDVTGKVTVDIADGKTGRVMESVSE